MQLFNIGETVIDTRTNRSVLVVAVVPSGAVYANGVEALFDLYALMEDAEFGGRIYWSDDAGLQVYNKYYWDDEEKDNESVH